MNTNSIRVPTKQITLTLKIPRLFHPRIWLALQIIKLASLIAPITIEARHER